MNKLIPDLYNSKVVSWHQKRRSSTSIFDRQISTFWYGTSSDVPRPSLSDKTAVGRQSNLGLNKTSLCYNWQIITKLNIYFHITYKRGIFDKHRSILCSLIIQTKVKNLNFLQCFGYPSFRSVPTNNVIMLGLPTASQTPSKLSILSLITALLPSYFETAYSMGDINQMWIRKSSKRYVLQYIQSYTFDFFLSFNHVLSRLT